jgi:hypothetical protein
LSTASRGRGSVCIGCLSGATSVPAPDDWATMEMKTLG